MKKIGIPIDNENGLESIVAQHFGRALAYAIVAEDKKSVEIIQNTSEHMGGQGKPPELLNNNKINVLLCSGLGRNAIYKFQNFGIEVFVGARGTVSETIDLYINGELQMATDENACKEARSHHHH